MPGNHQWLESTPVINRAASPMSDWYLRPRDGSEGDDGGGEEIEVLRRIAIIESSDSAAE
ncbi:MAG: hypothetical protein DWH81_02490 [Planctomycetota bacterium]|jgi:hypothetical protein|nr:MAG: hypothetical protein DWH81_02490 [Planctomycetota bacterium]